MSCVDPRPSLSSLVGGAQRDVSGYTTAQPAERASPGPFVRHTVTHQDPKRIAFMCCLNIWLPPFLALSHPVAALRGGQVISVQMRSVAGLLRGRGSHNRRVSPAGERSVVTHPASASRMCCVSRQRRPHSGRKKTQRGVRQLLARVPAHSIVPAAPPLLVGWSCSRGGAHPVSLKLFYAGVGGPRPRVPYRRPPRPPPVDWLPAVVQSGVSSRNRVRSAW